MSKEGPRGKTGRMGNDGPTGPAGPAGPVGSSSISNGNSIIIPSSNTPPSPAATGMIYCNTSLTPATLQFYNGIQWVAINNNLSSIFLPYDPYGPYGKVTVAEKFTGL